MREEPTHSKFKQFLLTSENPAVPGILHFVPKIMKTWQPKNALLPRT